MSGNTNLLASYGSSTTPPSFATWDPAATSAYTLSGGNLNAAVGGFNPNAYTQSTISKSSGIWYAEYTLFAVGSSSNGTKIGVSTGAGAGETFFATDGNVFNPVEFFPYSYSFTMGDIISLVMDLNANMIYFFLNGVQFTGLGDAPSPVSTTFSGVPMFFFLSNAFFSTNVTVNYGASAFTYFSTVQAILSGLTINPGLF